MDRNVLRGEQVGAVEVISIVDCTLDFPVGDVWPGADPADPDIADVLDIHQHLQLPVTCFVLRDQDTLTLVDTGVGPSPYSGFSFPLDFRTYAGTSSQARRMTEISCGVTGPESTRRN